MVGVVDHLDGADVIVTLDVEWTQAGISLLVGRLEAESKSILHVDMDFGAAVQGIKLQKII